jgi:plastocyanin
VAGAWLVAGCGATPGDDDATPTPGPGEIEIVATEYAFNPATITAAPGERLTILLRNQGTMAHNISFELPDGEVSLPQDVAPGSTGTLEVTAPDDAGNYTFYCPVDNHFLQGMEGTLTVE